MTLNRLWTATLLVLLAVTACGPTLEERTAMDRSRCASFGISFGSPDFGRCMMDLSQQRDQQDAEERRARREADLARDLARERRREREAAQSRSERLEYERARAHREGCDRVMKPIYC